ncbi:MAG: hypothetical protein J5544_03495 [Clostridia bacterium]|nr:hypothetical protein [Clostridia bacterium]
MKRNAENNSSKRKAIRIGMLVISLLLLVGAVGVSAKFITKVYVKGGSGTIPASTAGSPDSQAEPAPDEQLLTGEPEKTDDSAASQEPETTDEQEPVETEEPEATEEPEPEITEEPAATDEPGEQTGRTNE